MSKKFLLITSGSYVNAEMTADFGKLPPSFIPVGHKRLLEHQLELIEEFNFNCFISLPEDFKILTRDIELLNKFNVKIHWVNPNLNLAQSLLSFINAMDFSFEHELFILHGDTLFSEINDEKDQLYYGFTDMFYKWGQLGDILDDNLIVDVKKQAVISGYFSFGDVQMFKNELVRTNSFELALSRYNRKRPFQVKESKGWLDFGHSNLYYKSKVRLNVTRNFNKTKANLNYIEKSSSKKAKIESEFKWFKQLPDELKLFTPNVWSYTEFENGSSYNIEFIGAPTIQEKWVFGDLPNFVYFRIIDQVFSLIEKFSLIKFKAHSKRMIDDSFEKLYITKTRDRVIKYCEQVSFDANKKIRLNNSTYPSLNSFTKDILDVLTREIHMENSELSLTIMHGDLCFSNILVDNRSNLIKVIDPRGGFDDLFYEEERLKGDYRYDIAKFGHSLIGNYDFIVTGFYNVNLDMEHYNFELRIENEKNQELETYFYSKVKNIGVNEIFIKASIANLFISMLPLHSEDKDRQIALMLNAYNIFYN